MEAKDGGGTRTMIRIGKESKRWQIESSVNDLPTLVKESMASAVDNKNRAELEGDYRWWILYWLKVFLYN